MSEGRAGGFSACARECEAHAISRFDEALKSVLIPGVPTLDGSAARATIQERVAEYVEKAKHVRVKEAIAGADKHLQALLTPTAIDLLAHCPPGVDYVAADRSCRGSNPCPTH
jgi:hypothetical protein